MNTTRALLGTIIAGCVLIGACASSESTPDEEVGGSTAAVTSNCENEARIAVQQQRQNEAVGCNLTGPEWDSSLEVHLAFCQSNTPQVREALLRSRKDALDACMKAMNPDEPKDCWFFGTWC